MIRFATANGFTVVGGSRDAMDVQLKGSVATIETAFHVSMGLYHGAIENRDFYAPDREPTVDLPFQLWHISGLDNYSIPRPELVRRPPENQASRHDRVLSSTILLRQRHEGSLLRGNCSHGQRPEHRARWNLPDMTSRT